MAEELTVIARIHTDLPEKFGVPRQSGVVPELTGRFVFEPEFRVAGAVRGLEDFAYIWVLWGFEGTKREKWSPTVRPPRLGGNRKMGVFATRSPFRPNPIGLSSVRLESITQTAEGPVLTVSGIDMRDGTPIYDIKPYLPYADSHPEAEGGFAARVAYVALSVDFPPELLRRIPQDKQAALLAVLREDPRPHYQQDPLRIYGLSFGGFNVQFRVDGESLTVVDVTREQR